MLFAGLFFFLLYLLSLSNTIFGGDAGDLVAAVIARGFPHPPGYPFYTVLGIVFNQLPTTILTPAGKITLISTLSTVFSLLILYLILKEIAQKRFHPYSAGLTIAVIGFNYLIWLYAVIPEVFPLNTLIVLLIFFFCLKFFHSPKNGYLYRIAFLIGLGIAHHHTFVLILPSVFYLLFKKIKSAAWNSRLRFRLAAVFILGLSPLLYLPFSRLSVSEIIWGDPHTIAGFWSLLTRQGYGTFVAGPFVSNVLPDRFIQIINLAIMTFYDFSLAGSIFIVIGILGLFSSKTKILRPIRESIFFLLFLFGPFFVFYANFPLTSNFNFATLERFLIVFYFFLAIPLYLGIDIFLNFFKLLSRKILKSPFLIGLSNKAVLLILFLYPLAFGFKNFKTIITLKNNQIAENLGIDTLESAQSPSLILLGPDNILFNSQYVYYAKKYQNQRKCIIQVSKLYQEYYRDSLKKHCPDIVLPAKTRSLTANRLIKDNLGKFNIYSSEKYPLILKDYLWITQGLLFKLKKDEKNSGGDYQKLAEFWQNSRNRFLADDYLKNPKRFSNFGYSELIRLYAQAHLNSAYFLIAAGRPEEGYRHISEAITLNPEDDDNFYIFSLYYDAKGDCLRAEETIRKPLTGAKTVDPLYLNQLEKIAGCYRDENQKKRLEKIIRELKKSGFTPLEKI